MRTVEGTIEEILLHPISEDYVFVKLLDETPVLFPMEKIRSIYPNAMHVERKSHMPMTRIDDGETKTERGKQDDMNFLNAFYEEMKGEAADEETKALFDRSPS